MGVLIAVVVLVGLGVVYLIGVADGRQSRG